MFIKNLVHILINCLCVDKKYFIARDFIFFQFEDFYPSCDFTNFWQSGHLICMKE